MKPNPKSHDALFKWLIAAFTAEFFVHYFLAIPIGRKYETNIRANAKMLRRGCMNMRVTPGCVMTLDVVMHTPVRVQNSDRG